MLAAYHPVLVSEHDRMIASLLSAAPDRIRLPPITTIPTSRHELSPTFRRLCIELMAYTSDSRKAIIGIAQPVRFTLDHIFLALTIFRQPPDIDGAVYNLAEIVKKSVPPYSSLLLSSSELFLSATMQDGRKLSDLGSLMGRRYPSRALRVSRPGRGEPEGASQ